MWAATGHGHGRSGGRPGLRHKKMEKRKKKKRKGEKTGPGHGQRVLHQLIGRRFARVIFFFANSNFVHKGIKHVYPKSDFLTLKQKILQKKAEHIAVQYLLFSSWATN